ncbi:Threonine dehydratase biosynthetic [Klebsiella pneumoniae IS46]|nr:Threonine dehydratase biosynthetic [Klebsiella pneumoniae IS46]
MSGAPEGAEYLRAVLRAPVYEAVQKTPLQKDEDSRRGWITLFW